MKVILSLTSLALSLILASATMYQGDYVLTELYDEYHVIIPMPLDQEFRLHLEATNRDASFYSFGIKIGNAMSASMTVTSGAESDSVAFGPIFGTRMMPPPELRKVEDGLSKILPEASTISLTDGLLKLEGSKGGVVFTAI